jgi:NAD(P)-dependent dehydrogenase (short-subunit alcohol dehydrogenase family)
MTGPRVAVVTGGSAGVGRAAVRELAKRGWNVAVLARGEAGTHAAVAEVEQQGRRGMAVPVDVSDADAVDAVADQVERELGPISLWVNVAFVGALKYFWDMDDATYRRITETTYFGQVNGTRTALRLMRPRDNGVIINVGSALAFRGIPLQSAYCGAKHAVKGFTESVLTELKAVNSKVRLCTVQLPGMNTTQFDWNDNEFDGHPQPVAPIFQPETAARAIAYLADHPRRNMWVGVSTAYTILGNRLAPRFLDWYLAKTGVKGQLTDAKGPRFGSNVYDAKDDMQDRGAHGMFDSKAHPHDPWSWASQRRLPLGVGLAGAAAAAGGLVRSTRKD